MEADRALLDREARLRTFFDAGAHIAFLLADAEGRIVEWNPGAERSFGIPQEGRQY